jgi:hypothetical protein
VSDGPDVGYGPASDIPGVDFRPTGLAPRTEVRLGDALAPKTPEGVSWSFGAIVSIQSTSVTVELRGSGVTAANIPVSPGYVPQVGDVVLLLRQGPGYIVWGKASGEATNPTSPTPPRCYAWRSSNLALTDGAWTLVGLGSEAYDEPYGTMHDSTTNPSRVIAPEAGNYTVHCAVRTTTLASTLIQFEVRINAGGNQASGNRIIYHSQNGAGGGEDTGVGRSIDYDFAQGDYIELFVRVSTGANPDASLLGSGLAENTFLILRKNSAA